MFNISRMDLMWVSFYSIGLMILSVFLILLARHKINNKPIRMIVSFIAYVCLILAFLLMLPVLGGSNHG
ncbi:DUF2768 domain-containing protein [Abyssicoccus albus]|uniref:Uncharacterized protein DUF2768 n=1 Tax=Abyssicoccus albus TaxID=1817405 RepID=A0A3N5BJK1_9BACL|nr:DUF2768 domain-containing protein [Abyssicoccus albus]RPF58034.1 uncharacterized protein DUF2768 [Abyssicoccus albus]